MICFDHDGMTGVLLDDHVRCRCNFIGLVLFQLFLLFVGLYPRKNI